MKSTATSYTPEVVSDLPYSFKKMLESCPQVANQPLQQPYLSGHPSEGCFSCQCLFVPDQISEAGNVKYCYVLHARSGLRFAIRLHENA